MAQNIFVAGLRENGNYMYCEVCLEARKLNGMSQEAYLTVSVIHIIRNNSYNDECGTHTSVCGTHRFLTVRVPGLTTAFF